MTNSIMTLPINVFFVVSANSNIGYGHFKRCLLIAQEFLLHDVTPVFFIFEVNDTSILNLLKEKGFKFTLIREPYNSVSYLKSLLTSNKNLLIIDSDDKRFYKEDYQKGIIELNIQLMYITLFDDVHYFSHYILNPNIISRTQKYSTENYTIKFLGPEYFVLEDRFKKISPNKVKSEEKKVNLLVTFGSADPGDITIKVLELLEDSIGRFNKIRIVLGGLNPKIQEIKSHFLIDKYPKIFEIYVNTNRMYELMAKSHLAITSLGLTFWELLMHKVPCLVISGSEREKNVLTYFKKRKYCLSIGDYDDKNWHEDWLDKLNLHLNENSILKLNIEELYDSVNINGKTKLVNVILKNNEKNNN